MSDTEIVEGYTPNFEAWIKDFNEWQTRIGFDPSWLGDYRFDIKSNRIWRFQRNAQMGKKNANTSTKY